MRNRRRRGGCGITPILAAVAFAAALICLAVFSAKCVLLIVAVSLIALGVFLIRL